MRVSTFYLRLLGAALTIALVPLSAITLRATTIAPPDFTTLTTTSDYIVHARVKSVRSEKRASPSAGVIVTRVELQTLAVITGQPPATLTLELLGGQVGNEQLRVEGQPTFRVGDEDVLFIRGNGRVFCPLAGMAHGRYPVRVNPATGERIVVRADGTPLASVAQIPAPLSERSAASAASAPSATAASATLTLDDFVRLIRARTAGTTGPSPR